MHTLEVNRYLSDNESIISEETVNEPYDSSHTVDESGIISDPVKKIPTYTSLSEPYSVFTKSQKTLIVTIGSISGILSPLSANIYFPALTAIEEDLGTTTELVNLTVTVYMIFQGVSPAFWGSLADLWGRRPVYLATIAVYLGSCVGLAKTPSYVALLVLRMLQAFGSSSVVALGAGIISDVATPSERGTYSGIFSCVQMLGPVIGPVLGGIISEKLSWRWIFWLLLIIGAVLFVTILLFLPETLRSLVGNGSGYANPTPSQWIRRRLGKDPSQQQETTAAESAASYSRFKRIPNPCQPFLYLLEPDMAIALIFYALHYAVYYCYLTSMPTQFSELYGLDQLEVGLCFLVQGAGCVIGSFCEGRILDHDFLVIARASNLNMKRGKLTAEFPIFKARFRTMWFHSTAFQALTLVYGWVIYVKAPLPVSLVLQFFVGFTITSMFNVFQTLVIDLFPGKGATVTASNNLVRCLFGAVATVSIEPGIKGVGTGWMFTILGLILVVSNILPIVLLRYGPHWREKRMTKQQQQQQQQFLLEKSKGKQFM